MRFISMSCPEGREFIVQSHSPAPTQLSLAKEKIRILLLEGVNDAAVAMMNAAGYANLERLPKALGGSALREAVKGVHLLGIRSRTQINAEVLDAADRLIAIGCSCAWASTIAVILPWKPARRFTTAWYSAIEV